jgi:hypothetical protein
VLSPRPPTLSSMEVDVTISNKCGAIGFTKDPDITKATVRMEATLEAVRQFLTQHPDIFLVGPETENTTIFFGPRELLVGAANSRVVPSHGSGPGGPAWQPPKGEKIHQC